MTASDFRSRLEALLGETNTISRAAAALGCHRRTVHRWLDPDDPAPVPEWAIRHVETAEQLIAALDSLERATGMRAGQWFPRCWQKPPPP